MISEEENLTLEWLLILALVLCPVFFLIGIVKGGWKWVEKLEVMNKWPSNQ